MKRAKYQTVVELPNQIFLHYNSFSDKYILMNKDCHDKYDNDDILSLSENDKDLYNKLVESKYYIDDNVNELDVILYNRLCQKMDSKVYHIVINTTLDCNLKCWYCYEKRSKNSELKKDVISAIKKNISSHYNDKPYSMLKISFFGGEPFMNFSAIQDILLFSKDFCLQNNIRLVADFTTNSTLITKNEIDFLKDYECLFQITLDGNREQHNKIKKIAEHDTYQLTIDNIYQLSNSITNVKIWIRINYDETTLMCIDTILNDLNALDRSKSFIILRKIWQISLDKIDSKILLGAIQKALNAGFIVDCYPLTKKRLCFAERINQALINFDGKIFKCSTLPSFDNTNSLGQFNLQSGKIEWDENKISQITKVLYSEKCMNCVLFGTCYGSCNKTLLENPAENFCILQELNMTIQEYLMYNFKLSMINSSKHEM